MVTKILFLDIDGVLNNTPFLESTASGSEICTRNVMYLNEVLQATGCKVVVSSSWRNYHTWHELLTTLSIFGVNTMPFVGKTGDYLPAGRGQEILEFLTARRVRFPNEDVVYAVVDDIDSDMDPVRDRLVKTDPDVGLDKETSDKLIEILNGIPEEHTLSA